MCNIFTKNLVNETAEIVASYFTIIAAYKDD